MLPISSIRNHSDRPGNPVALLQIPGEVADRVEAPGGRFPREADRFERDGHLGAPAPRARRSGRQPVGVPGDVPRAPVVRPTFVLLGAQRVHHEHVGVVVVVERVEDEGHRVVLPHLAVAPGDRAGDGVGIRVAALDPEIDHPFVIEDTDDGALGGRRAGDRLELGEGLDGGRPVPRRLVQYAVDFDGFRRSRGSDLLGSKPGTPRQRQDRTESSSQTIAVGPSFVRCHLPAPSCPSDPPTAESPVSFLHRTMAVRVGPRRDTNARRVPDPAPTQTSAGPAGSRLVAEDSLADRFPGH